MIACLKGLLISGIGGCSLGRLAFWIVFAVAVAKWWQGADIPEGQLITLLSCLGYLLGGKFKAVALSGKDAKTIKKGEDGP
jgi:hypothetical protein